METSFAMEGNYRGIPCTDVGTYTSVLRGGGVLYGEGQGVITTKDGQGMATWTGQGKGKFTAPGKVSFRGSTFLRTPSTSQGGKLSSLNNMVGVFGYEVEGWEVVSPNLGVEVSVEKPEKTQPKESAPNHS